MNELEKLSLDFESGKKKFAKTFVNNIGLFIGVFIVFAVVVIMTTDIHLVSAETIASLGLDFFLLLFCSYSMYVCCSDSGTKASLGTATYTEAVERFTVLKNRIIDGQMQTRLLEFCHHYIEEELRSTRMTLLAVVGLSYGDYQEKYMRLDDTGVDAIAELTEAQKKAIKKANKIKPVKLTPEMMLRHGRNAHRRSPLEVNPATKKNFQFGFKFAQICILSFGMSLIALDVIVEPSWIVFASVCLKLFTVIVNGFEGFKIGYDNILVDTVNYINGQTDLMQQAINYIETSEKTSEISLVAATNE